MLRCILLRLALPALAIAGLLAIPAMPQTSQSQDSQSVADAARRAREEKKKAAAKPAKVITEDDVKPAADTSGGAPANAAASSPSGASKAASAAGGPEDAQKSKEIAALKEQIKQAQGDLDLLQREKALQQDTYYSNPDYVHDTAGKAKIDSMNQQVADKQEELDRLKAHLAELGGTMENSPAPAAPGGTPPPQM